MPPTLYTSFTSRDFTSIYEWLISILREEVSEMTDLNASDAGISLIRLIARATDSMSLYIDEAFAESFIHSAKFKQSLIDIARSLDLLPKLPNAARAPARITRKHAGVGNVDSTGLIVLPQYTTVSKNNGIAYLLSEEVILAVGETYKDVEIIQGVYETINLTSSNFTLDPKTGRYLYNLGANVAADTVGFIENSVVIWSEEESFWRSFPTDEHFVLEAYADKYNGISDTIFFAVGNGTRGKSLTPGSAYTLSYIRCDGAAGNTGAGTIVNVEDGYDYFVTVTNTSAATGGAGVEPIEDFRTRIPLVVRTQRRAVTKEDYKALILSVPGVKRVQALDRNDDGFFPWEYVKLYVVPEGGGAMSTTLYNSIMDVCRERGALGGWYKRYLIYNAEESPVDVVAHIGVEHGYASNSVISSVTATINSFFSVDNFDISEVFNLGELHSAIMNTTGVSWVELPGMESITPSNGYIITVGSISASESI